jgi:hypothetical protein
MNYKKPLVYFVVLSTLFSLVPVVPFNYSSAATCDPDALRPVSYGQRGAAVRNAQACLIEAGYDIPAGATGYYGNQTRNAVREFYKDWYGAWSGDRLGPQGVQQLRSLLARGSEQPTETEITTEQPTSEQPQQTQQNNQFMQLLTLLLPFLGVNLDATTTNQLMQALSSGDLTQLATLLATLRQSQQQQQQQQQQEEGILIVEKNPTPSSGQQLYEGQTADWVGVRFRAQDSDITVSSFKLVYPKSNNSVPARVVSKFEVVDESGNVLKTIDPSLFTQDYTTLDYYYYVTGLNYVVPKGGQRVLIVRATAVQTFPSGPANTLRLIVQDVRGRDSAGIDRFPSNQVLNDVSRQSTLASAARFEVSRNSGSPVENNVIADYATGRANKVALLKVDFTAKNDRVQLTQLSGSTTFSGPITVSNVYLMDGANVLDSAVVESNSYTFSNLLSQNIWVERDTTKSLVIAADITGATTSDGTVSVTVTSLSRKNSLGDTGTQPVSGVSGDTLHVFTEAPMFAKGQTFNVAVVRDQNNSTTTANATLEVLVTAKGGSIKISSSTVFTLLWETNSGVATSVAKAVSEVRDSSNNSVSQSSDGYYVVPVNQTYTFVIQDQRPFPGAPRVRVKVDAITWRNSANTDITSSWTDRDLLTGWSN